MLYSGPTVASECSSREAPCRIYCINSDKESSEHEGPCAGLLNPGIGAIGSQNKIVQMPS